MNNKMYKNNRNPISKRNALLHRCNYIFFGQMPLSITKGQLKHLLKEVCHIHLQTHAIDECVSGDTKFVVLNIGDQIIPKIAKERLRRLGRQILTEVCVQVPSYLHNRFKVQMPLPLLVKYGVAPHNTKLLKMATEVVEWLHYELHLKYPQLEAIDAKCNNVVFTTLGRKITDRVITMLQSSNHATTMAAFAHYRKLHPSFGDFEMVSLVINRAERKFALPFTHYTEAELMVPVPPPLDEAQERVQWESQSKILTDKIQSYMATLNTEVSPDDSPEMIARRKLRQTMKDFSNHVPQVLRYHSSRDITDTPDWICLYFLMEPKLPSKGALMSLLQNHGVEVYETQKNPLMYNAVKVFLARSHYDKVMELDGCDTEIYDGVLPFEKKKTTEKLYIRHPHGDYWKNKYLLPSFQAINDAFSHKNFQNQQHYVPKPRPPYANQGKLSNAFFV